METYRGEAGAGAGVKGGEGGGGPRSSGSSSQCLPSPEVGTGLEGSDRLSEGADTSGKFFVDTAAGRIGLLNGGTTLVAGRTSLLEGLLSSYSGSCLCAYDRTGFKSANFRDLPG
jgi:hypothetical protein